MNTVHNTTEKRLILIVDDNETNRYILSNYIDSFGHISITAENGRNALEIMKEQSPDLILLDILMPEMDGYELLKHLKSSPATASIPVVIISAVDDTNNIAQCIELGADDYMTKPFNIILLRSRIKSALEKKNNYDQQQKIHIQLEKSYKKLREAEEARDALTNMIVHDMNNLLGGIIGSAELLINKTKLCKCEDNKKTIKYASNIYTISMDMSLFIERILTLSKLESGNMPMLLENIEVVSLSNDIIKQFHDKTSKHNITLDFIPGDNQAIYVLADQHLLSRIIVNLLSNAIKHSNRDTHVKFSIKREKDSVILIVSDNGAGIPKEHINTIFDKFTQVKKHEAKSYGTGLGLAFCKTAVIAQNGSIWVESELGKGSAFYVKLPAGKKPTGS